MYGQYSYGAPQYAEYVATCYLEADTLRNVIWGQTLYIEADTLRRIGYSFQNLYDTLRHVLTTASISADTLRAQYVYILIIRGVPQIEMGDYPTSMKPSGVFFTGKPMPQAPFKLLCSLDFVILDYLHQLTTTPPSNIKVEICVVNRFNRILERKEMQKVGEGIYEIDFDPSLWDQRMLFEVQVKAGATVLTPLLGVFYFGS